jgi:Major Vault Protein repeat domain
MLKNYQPKPFENVYQLKSNEKLQDFMTPIKRAPGDEWLIYGPCNFIPAVQVDVIRK